MVNLARRNLGHEKSKIAISIGGVILAVFLILTMMGLHRGFSTMMEDMAHGTGADLWVTTKGASGSLHSPSILPLGLQDNLTQIEGVREVVPFIRTPISTDLDSTKVLLYINSFDDESQMGGPWKLWAGASQVQDGEIIVDKSLAIKFNLLIGENLTIEEREFRIVGLSDQTNLMIAYMIFITFEDAKGFLIPGVTNYFLVNVEDASELELVKETIEESIDDISVSTTHQTAEAYKDEILGGFLPIFYILGLIGLLVGIQVIAVLLYNLTMEKAREYGILKAIGASNFQLYKVVLTQALIISVLGFLIGAIVVPPLISVLQIFVPEFYVLITLDMILFVSFLGILTGLFAAILPVKKLTGIDPALVFKEE